MTFWSVAAALGFGGMLLVTAAIQPSGWRWRKLVKKRDPCSYVPTWTFFAPDPGVTDARLLWRERLVDGTVGPWHESVPPQGGLLRAIWNPTKRARKVATDFRRMIEREEEEAGDEELRMLGLPYLMILQHVLGIDSSPLGAARQFAVVSTEGADDEDGLFELVFVSSWHRLPGARLDPRSAEGRPAELVEQAL
jgi:hypothetical protein